MKRPEFKISWPRVASMLLFLTLVGSILFVIVRLTGAPLETEVLGEHTQRDYLLMLLQCTLGLAVMFLPALLERRLSIIFPSAIYILYLVFLYCAIYLGEVRNFYYAVPSWDSILHFFSGAMLGALGFVVVNLLNKDERITVHLSPAFVALFALCFAVTLGVLWEFYEFFSDGAFGLNMQKVVLADGTVLAGREALSDTMKDLILDFLSALIISVIGYLSCRRDRKWVLHFNVKQRDRKGKNMAGTKELPEEENTDEQTQS